jgi:hypothetical protein
MTHGAIVAVVFLALSQGLGTGPYGLTILLTAAGLEHVSDALVLGSCDAAGKRKTHSNEANTQCLNMAASLKNDLPLWKSFE